MPAGKIIKARPPVIEPTAEGEVAVLPVTVQATTAQEPLTQSPGSLKPVIAEAAPDPIRESAIKLSELVHRADVGLIMRNPNYKRHEKNYRLSLLGLNRNEISFLTQSTPGNISRDIWSYKKGLKALTPDPDAAA